MFTFIQVAVQTFNLFQTWCFNDPKLTRRYLALSLYGDQCDEVTPKSFFSYCDKHYNFLKTVKIIT